MAGENPMEEHTGDPAEFTAHPRWQRFIIAAAGPIMNGVLCVAVLTGVNMVHYEDYPFLRQPAVVGWVEPNSPAAKAGIQVGDQIVQVGSVETPNWQKALDQLVLSTGQATKLTLERGDQSVSAELPAVTPMAGGGEQLGMLPNQPYIVTHLQDGFPAAEAGIRVGDEVVSVDGHAIRGNTALSDYLQQARGQAVTLGVVRNGASLGFRMTPKLTDANGQKRYVVGLVAQGVKIERLPLPVAFNQALVESREDSFLILELLKRLMSHQASIKSLSSVVGIAGMTGEATREGLIPVLQILAALSLNLGILNLLPIPILDGGLILLLAIEGVMRRDIKREVKEMVYQAAFVFLVIFTVVVIYNDIAKIVVSR
jgi:regulator of sigma E protease